MKRVSRLFLFISIQLILYVTFLKLDLQGDSIDLSSRIKFCVIILCFCYVIFKREGIGARDLSLVRAALFFTLISDFIILFLEAELYSFGVLSFIIVQQLYGIRLDVCRNRSKERPELEGFWLSLLLRVAVQSAITVMILILLDRFGVVRDGLLTITVFYFICLVTNVIRAIAVALRTPKNMNSILFAVGLFFFLLCDINVGLFNLSGFISASGKAFNLLYALASVLMWTFYAPSQVLIAVSSDRFRQK